MLESHWQRSLQYRWYFWVVANCNGWTHPMWCTLYPSPGPGLHFHLHSHLDILLVMIVSNLQLVHLEWGYTMFWPVPIDWCTWLCRGGCCWCCGWPLRLLWTGNPNGPHLFRISIPTSGCHIPALISFHSPSACLNSPHRLATLPPRRLWTSPWIWGLLAFAWCSPSNYGAHYWIIITRLIGARTGRGYFTPTSIILHSSHPTWWRRSCGSVSVWWPTGMVSIFIRSLWRRGRRANSAMLLRSMMIQKYSWQLFGVPHYWREWRMSEVQWFRWVPPEQFQPPNQAQWSWPGEGVETVASTGSASMHWVAGANTSAASSWQPDTC